MIERLNKNWLERTHRFKMKFGCGCILYGSDMDIGKLYETHKTGKKILGIKNIFADSLWDGVFLNNVVVELCPKHHEVWDKEQDRQSRIKELEAELQKVKAPRYKQ